MDRIHILSEVVQMLHDELQEKQHVPAGSRGSHQTRTREDRQPIGSRHHSLRGFEVRMSHRREYERSHSEGKMPRSLSESSADFTPDDSQ